ncbi:oxygen-dependent tRNA uridine(34) hydroxylase TrhO [Rickettsiales endosymbiont of Stachyamoeba lipophora]|uniref:oxygen-dependent tRNA uridine(34) hydroxylase TrhO n=1 Tax=Rickettsiales endosymbiont of Stachyamoeba lipophora TaxID=2486578 RepID=UPI000F645234|nr:rhodanese-like domain-containing protein [Rickettsiales endosymbiont of Stachyamoeba lipophora]AZL16415.1 hypothetical protein EF513_07770 [Rickettsiales endosymbiont of Stachyamoeba lipophora]
MPKIVVAAFYAFKEFSDLENIQSKLLEICENGELKGTILIAREGINSTIAGSREAIDTLKNFLLTDLALTENIEYKESFADNKPFKRLKVKLKKEIITFNEQLNVEEQKGQYLTSKQWEDLILDNNTIVIDTRNDYEVGEGSFKGAINPNINKFTELKPWIESKLPELKDKNVAMFCTGGIRCEKSTAYLKNLGVEKVFHLKGGILKYLEDTANENELWEGKCFVFDERRTVDEELK